MADDADRNFDEIKTGSVSSDSTDISAAAEFHDRLKRLSRTVCGLLESIDKVMVQRRTALKLHRSLQGIGEGSQDKLQQVENSFTDIGSDLDLDVKQKGNRKKYCKCFVQCPEKKSRNKNTSNNAVPSATSKHHSKGSGDYILSSFSSSNCTSSSSSVVCEKSSYESQRHENPTLDQKENFAKADELNCSEKLKSLASKSKNTSGTIESIFSCKCGSDCSFLGKSNHFKTVGSKNQGSFSSKSGTTSSMDTQPPKKSKQIDSKDKCKSPSDLIATTKLDVPRVCYTSKEGRPEDNDKSTKIEDFEKNEAIHKPSTVTHDTSFKAIYNANIKSQEFSSNSVYQVDFAQISNKDSGNYSKFDFDPDSQVSIIYKKSKETLKIFSRSSIEFEGFDNQAEEVELAGNGQREDPSHQENNAIFAGVLQIPSEQQDFAGFSNKMKVADTHSVVGRDSLSSNQLSRTASNIQNQPFIDTDRRSISPIATSNQRILKSSCSDDGTLPCVCKSLSCMKFRSDHADITPRTNEPILHKDASMHSNTSKSTSARVDKQIPQEDDAVCAVENFQEPVILESRLRTSRDQPFPSARSESSHDPHPFEIDKSIDRLKIELKNSPTCIESSYYSDTSGTDSWLSLKSSSTHTKLSENPNQEILSRKSDQKLSVCSSSSFASLSDAKMSSRARGRKKLRASSSSLSSTHSNALLESALNGNASLKAPSLHDVLSIDQKEPSHIQSCKCFEVNETDKLNSLDISLLSCQESTCQFRRGLKSILSSASLKTSSAHVDHTSLASCSVCMRIENGESLGYSSDDVNASGKSCSSPNEESPRKSSKKMTESKNHRQSCSCSTSSFGEERKSKDLETLVKNSEEAANVTSATELDFNVVDSIGNTYSKLHVIDIVNNLSKSSSVDGDQKSIMGPSKTTPKMDDTKEITPSAESSKSSIQEDFSVVDKKMQLVLNKMTHQADATSDVDDAEDTTAVAPTKDTEATSLQKKYSDGVPNTEEDSGGTPSVDVISKSAGEILEIKMQHMAEDSAESNEYVLHNKDTSPADRSLKNDDKLKRCLCSKCGKKKTLSTEDRSNRSQTISEINNTTSLILYGQSVTSKSSVLDIWASQKAIPRKAKSNSSKNLDKIGEPEEILSSSIVPRSTSTERLDHFVQKHGQNSVEIDDTIRTNENNILEKVSRGSLLKKNLSASEEQEIIAIELNVPGEAIPSALVSNEALLQKGSSKQLPQTDISVLKVENVTCSSTSSYPSDEESNTEQKQIDEEPMLPQNSVTSSSISNKRLNLYSNLKETSETKQSMGEGFLSVQKVRSENASQEAEFLPTDAGGSFHNTGVINSSSTKEQVGKSGSEARTSMLPVAIDRETTSVDQLHNHKEASVAEKCSTEKSSRSASLNPMLVAPLKQFPSKTNIRKCSRCGKRKRPERKTNTEKPLLGEFCKCNKCGKRKNPERPKRCSVRKAPVGSFLHSQDFGKNKTFPKASTTSSDKESSVSPPEIKLTLCNCCKCNPILQLPKSSTKNFKRFGDVEKKSSTHVIYTRHARTVSKGRKNSKPTLGKMPGTAIFGGRKKSPSLVPMTERKQLSERNERSKQLSCHCGPRARQIMNPSDSSTSTQDMFHYNRSKPGSVPPLSNRSKVLKNRKPQNETKLSHESCDTLSTNAWSLHLRGKSLTKKKKKKLSYSIKKTIRRWNIKTNSAENATTTSKRTPRFNKEKALNVVYLENTSSVYLGHVLVKTSQSPLHADHRRKKESSSFSSSTTFQQDHSRTGERKDKKILKCMCDCKKIKQRAERDSDHEESEHVSSSKTKRNRRSYLSRRPRKKPSKNAEASSSGQSDSSDPTPGAGVSPQATANANLTSRGCSCSRCDESVPVKTTSPIELKPHLAPKGKTNCDTEDHLRNSSDQIKPLREPIQVTKATASSRDPSDPPHPSKFQRVLKKPVDLASVLLRPRVLQFTLNDSFQSDDDMSGEPIKLLPVSSPVNALTSASSLGINDCACNELCPENVNDINAPIDLKPIKKSKLHLRNPKKSVEEAGRKASIKNGPSFSKIQIKHITQGKSQSRYPTKESSNDQSKHTIFTENQSQDQCSCTDLCESPSRIQTQPIEFKLRTFPSSKPRISHKRSRKSFRSAVDKFNIKTASHEITSTATKTPSEPQNSGEVSDTRKTLQQLCNLSALWSKPKASASYPAKCKRDDLPQTSETESIEIRPHQAKRSQWGFFPFKKKQNALQNSRSTLRINFNLPESTDSQCSCNLCDTKSLQIQAIKQKHINHLQFIQKQRISSYPSSYIETSEAIKFTQYIQIHLFPHKQPLDFKRTGLQSLMQKPRVPALLKNESISIITKSIKVKRNLVPTESRPVLVPDGGPVTGSSSKEEVPPCTCNTCENKSKCTSPKQYCKPKRSEPISLKPADLQTLLQRPRVPSSPDNDHLVEVIQPISIKRSVDAGKSPHMLVSDQGKSMLTTATSQPIQQEHSPFCTCSTCQNKSKCTRPKKKCSLPHKDLKPTGIERLLQKPKVPASLENENISIITEPIEMNRDLMSTESPPVLVPGGGSVAGSSSKEEVPPCTCNNCEDKRKCTSPKQYCKPKRSEPISLKPADLQTLLQRPRVLSSPDNDHLFEVIQPISIKRSVDAGKSPHMLVSDQGKSMLTTATSQPIQQEHSPFCTCSTCQNKSKCTRPKKKCSLPHKDLKPTGIERLLQKPKVPASLENENIAIITEPIEMNRDLMSTESPPVLVPGGGSVAGSSSKEEVPPCTCNNCEDKRKCTSPKQYCNPKRSEPINLKPADLQTLLQRPRVPSSPDNDHLVEVIQPISIKRNEDAGKSPHMLVSDKGKSMLMTSTSQPIQQEPTPPCSCSSCIDKTKCTRLKQDCIPPHKDYVDLKRVGISKLLQKPKLNQISYEGRTVQETEPILLKNARNASLIDRRNYYVMGAVSVHDPSDSCPCNGCDDSRQHIASSRWLSKFFQRPKILQFKLKSVDVLLLGESSDEEDSSDANSSRDCSCDEKRKFRLPRKKFLCIGCFPRNCGGAAALDGHENIDVPMSWTRAIMDKVGTSTSASDEDRNASCYRKSSRCSMDGQDVSSNSFGVKQSEVLNSKTQDDDTDAIAAVNTTFVSTCVPQDDNYCFKDHKSVLKQVQIRQVNGTNLFQWPRVPQRIVVKKSIKPESSYSYDENLLTTSEGRNVMPTEKPKYVVLLGSPDLRNPKTPEQVIRKHDRSPAQPSEMKPWGKNIKPPKSSPVEVKPVESGPVNSEHIASTSGSPRPFSSTQSQQPRNVNTVQQPVELLKMPIEIKPGNSPSEKVGTAIFSLILKPMALTRSKNRTERQQMQLNSTVLGPGNDAAGMRSPVELKVTIMVPRETKSLPTVADQNLVLAGSKATEPIEVKGNTKEDFGKKGFPDLPTRGHNFPVELKPPDKALNSYPIALKPATTKLHHRQVAPASVEAKPMRSHQIITHPTATSTNERKPPAAPEVNPSVHAMNDGSCPCKECCKKPQSLNKNVKLKRSEGVRFLQKPRILPTISAFHPSQHWDGCSCELCEDKTVCETGPKECIIHRQKFNYFDCCRESAASSETFKDTQKSNTHSMTAATSVTKVSDETRQDSLQTILAPAPTSESSTRPDPTGTVSSFSSTMSSCSCVVIIHTLTSTKRMQSKCISSSSESCQSESISQQSCICQKDSETPSREMIQTSYGSVISTQTEQITEHEGSSNLSCDCQVNASSLPDLSQSESRFTNSQDIFSESFILKEEIDPTGTVSSFSSTMSSCSCVVTIDTLTSAKRMQSKCIASSSESCQSESISPETQFNADSKNSEESFFSCVSQQSCVCQEDSEASSRETIQTSYGSVISTQTEQITELEGSSNLSCDCQVNASSLPDLSQSESRFTNSQDIFSESFILKSSSASLPSNEDDGLSFQEYQSVSILESNSAEVSLNMDEWSISGVPSIRSSRSESSNVLIPTMSYTMLERSSSHPSDESRKPDSGKNLFAPLSAPSRKQRHCLCDVCELNSEKPKRAISSEKPKRPQPAENKRNTRESTKLPEKFSGSKTSPLCSTCGAVGVSSVIQQPENVLCMMPNSCSVTYGGQCGCNKGLLNAHTCFYDAARNLLDSDAEVHGIGETAKTLFKFVFTEIKRIKGLIQRGFNSDNSNKCSQIIDHCDQSGQFSTCPCLSLQKYYPLRFKPVHEQKICPFSELKPFESAPNLARCFQLPKKCCTYSGAESKSFQSTTTHHPKPSVTVRSVKPVGQNSLMVTWMLDCSKDVGGYEVYVDSNMKCRTFTPSRNTAIVYGVDVDTKHHIRVIAVPEKGLLSRNPLELRHHEVLANRRNICAQTFLYQPQNSSI